jgi:hypothetical protein
MSWLSFLSPPWALMALIAIPILLLYILRQRRPDLPVSSTLLWSKTLADMRASTPFQKLRRHLLLFLQLLILAALVFTLMRPVVQAQASQSQAGVIVLDATASMQTHDAASSESRLDRAKIEAKTLVDRMRPGDRFMLIADGGGITQVRSGFSSSKSELKSLIDSVKPSDTPSDLSESLLLAATSLRAIGSTDDKASKDALAAGQVWLFSDGAGIRLPDTLGDKNNLLQFIQIGSSDHSVGITRLSITPIPKTPGAYEVFVGLKNAWPVEKKVGVTLALGSKDNFLPNQAKFVTLPPGSTGGIAFENVTASPGRLFARVDDTDDDFPLDNTTYGIIEPPRKVRVVLVTKGNDFFEQFLQTAVNIGLADGQVLAPEFFNPAAPADLFILDGFLPPPDRFPRVDTLLVRPRVTGTGTGPVDAAGFPISHEIQNPTILRWKREDPLMQAIQLGDLRIYNSLLMDRDPAAVELISAPEGPLAAYKDFAAQRRYFLAFSPLQESNWWRLSSLLMFMQNLIDQTRERHFIGMPQLVAAGNTAKLYGTGDHAQVTLPNGDTLDVPAKDGIAEFAQTDHLGFYEVGWPAASPQNGATSTLFAVNLINPTESDIRPQPLQAAANTVRTSTSVARVNREIWRWLAAVALVILLLEWWAYHRRVA